MITLATSNLNKLKEYKKLFPHFEFKLMEKTNINEDGNSFLENAYIKAKTIYDKTHEDVMADDSGLEILALKGFPGIFSSRFENNRGYKVASLDLLDRLKPFDDRRARFVCAIVLITKDGNKYSALGYFNGHIGYEYKGDNGFGYDPIFIPDGYDCSVAELDEDIKNNISHRYIASKKLLEKLPNRYYKRYYHD